MDWDNVITILDRRFERGIRALDRIPFQLWGQKVLVVTLMIILIPFWVPIYCIGWIGELLDNHKNGIKTVKE